MDWLAKLVALSYLLSRYLSLTILKLLLVQHFLKEAIHYQYLSDTAPKCHEIYPRFLLSISQCRRKLGPLVDL